MKKITLLQALLVVSLSFTPHISLCGSKTDRNEFIESVKKHKKAILITAGVTTTLGLCWWKRNLIIKTTKECVGGFLYGFMLWHAMLLELISEGKVEYGSNIQMGASGKLCSVLGGMTNASLVLIGLATCISKAKELKNSKEQSKNTLKKINQISH